jgi:hypothetical protein
MLLQRIPPATVDHDGEDHLRQTRLWAGDRLLQNRSVGLEAVHPEDLCVRRCYVGDVYFVEDLLARRHVAGAVEEERHARRIGPWVRMRAPGERRVGVQRREIPLADDESVRNGNQHHLPGPTGDVAAIQMPHDGRSNGLGHLIELRGALSPRSPGRTRVQHERADNREQRGNRCHHRNALAQSLSSRWCGIGIGTGRRLVQVRVFGLLNLDDALRLDHVDVPAAG